MESLVEDVPKVQSIEIEEHEKEINLFKTSVAEKQEQFLNKIIQNMSKISYSSAKAKELFSPNQQTKPALILPQLEFEYLIDVLKQCCFIVSLNNDVLELKVDNTKTFTFEFDSSYFACYLSKISLNCPQPLLLMQAKALNQILKNVMGLKDLTLQFQRINTVTSMSKWI